MAHDNAKLADKTALITGGSRRLGAAIARTLHGAGMNVIIHYHRSAQAAKDLATDLNRQRSNSAISLKADLLHTTALAPMIVEATTQWNRLDLLVNNASTFYPTPLAKATETQWDDLMGTNFKAPFFLSQAAAPQLRKSHGSIINMVDIHAQRPMHEYSIYCAAKAGLVMLTRALAGELGPDVRVNGIAPGAILWSERGIDETAKQKILARTALKRVGETADIAKAVLYLTRDAPYITGQIITVDGGRSIGW